MSEENPGDVKCPTDCPNRKTEVDAAILGKGYRYGIAIALTILICWFSIDISRTKTDGWAFKTRDVPISILLPCLGLIGSVLGIRTDALAGGLGNLLVGKKP